MAERLFLTAAGTSPRLRFGSSYFNTSMPQSVDLDAPQPATLGEQLEEMYRTLDERLQGVVPTASMASPGFTTGPCWRDSPRG
jgi:hypothetical protein